MNMTELPFPFPPPVGRHRVARGLFLRVNAQGASWVMRYTINGRPREAGLGAFLAMTLEQAGRATAQVLLKWESAHAEIALGRDPIESKNESRAQAKVQELRRKSGTLLKVARQYHEACVEPLVSSKYARDWSREFEHDVPAWILNMPAQDITSEDVLRAVAEIPSSLGQRAQKARQRIDQVCEWMIRHNKVTSNAAGVRRNTREKWRNRLDMGAPSIADTLASAHSA